MIEVKKREGEAPNSLFYAFTKKVKRSGVLKEARARRFKTRPSSRQKRKLSALHRAAKKNAMERQRKLGNL